MALHKTVAISAVAAGIMLSLGAAQAAPLLGATEATTMKASDLAAKEKALTDFPLMESVKSSIQTLPNSEVEKIARAWRATRRTLSVLKASFQNRIGNICSRCAPQNIPTLIF